MSGLFQTLNVSKGAMFAQQHNINVTSHNIANVSTPGFSRQHLVLQTGRPQTIIGAGQVGTGVVVNEVLRTRNTFLDYQIRKESSYLGNFDVREQYLTEIEGILNEPSDTGLSKLLSDYYNAWHIVAGSPEKTDSRAVLAQKSKALTDELNHTYKKLTDVKINAQEEIEHNIYQTNTILEQINIVNKEIKTVTVAGNNPNDLLDKRDLLLDELSSKFEFSKKDIALNGIKLWPTGTNYDDKFMLVENQDIDEIFKLQYVTTVGNEPSSFPGTVDIIYRNKDGVDITKSIVVDEQQYKDLAESHTIWIDEKGEPVSDVDKMIFRPDSGKFGGLMSVHTDADKYIGELNKLAKAIAYSTNAIHNEGYDDTNSFFIDKSVAVADKNTKFDGITAENITVNDDILKNPMLIHTAADSKSGSTHNERAIALAQLRDFAMDITKMDGKYQYSKFMTDHIDTSTVIPTKKSIVGGAKVESYFKTTVSELGVEGQRAQRIVKNQGELLEGLVTRRASVSGVSMDEETVNLIQFQHAYQANAKMISTVDELLDVVINGLKR
ncbi:flagellar hook-associated protein FlgK [Clostridium sp. UBA4548]|uniref:flagellar hook-associated protein FlgK n=1 Tax=Clostridium sp. UBA4548 TaxID=1946361 RepID=UPI0025B9F222|nr:flagellar hook-associated protein FlgK [Clostridium sp. UBA4548]